MALAASVAYEYLSKGRLMRPVGSKALICNTSDGISTEEPDSVRCGGELLLVEEKCLLCV